jgi:putative sterol carrier protein
MDATSEFFENMSHKRHLPLLENLEGTVGFDITNGKKTDHLRVTIDHGDVEATNQTKDADCVVKADRVLFNDILVGEENVMAALLRGAVQIEGNPRYVVSLQRLLPSPSTSSNVKRGAAERNAR